MSSDPFPMRSDEARRLEQSTTTDEASSGSTTTNWNTMVTTTSTSTSTNIHSTNSNSNNSTSDHEAHFIKQKRTKKDNNGSGGDIDIYANIDSNDNTPKTKIEHYLETEDEYFDTPMNNNNNNNNYTKSRRNNPIIKLLLSLHHHMYGNTLPIPQLLRTLCLSMTLFFMIGGYWLLRSLKDPVLSALCGVTAIPKAKMLSVGVVLVVVSIYNKLLDSSYHKHTLFYIFGMVYFVIFVTISLMLKHPTIGLPNQNPSYDRILGWISYCAIESFGSVMVSLFWSFTNSNFDFESAKSSYGLLTAAAQIGSILGPTIVKRYAESWGVANIYFVGALAMLLLQGCLWTYVTIYGTNETNAIAIAIGQGHGHGLSQVDAVTTIDTPKKKSKKKAGVLEGIHLFIKYHYVKGIFAISCLFMVEVTIIDYTMKVLAKDHFSGLHPCVQGNTCWDVSTAAQHGMSASATAAFTTFMGLFGQATNTLSFFLSFFGTSAIIRYLGLRIVLLLFPTLCLIVIVTVRLHPTLYVVFAAMMILKANSYALNNPTKEMLYQPTSSAVRYKAKSWIDIFGARGSKALGSVVTNAFSDSATNLVHNGSVVGIAVASFLIWNARYMGRTFEHYIATGYVVGEDDEEDDDDGGTDGHNSMVQNDGEEGTSCAIYDDDKEIKENISDHTEEGRDNSDAAVVVDDVVDDDDDDSVEKVEMV